MSPAPSADPPKELRTLKLEICFDGLSFSGWQVQPSQPEVRTVQEAYAMSGKPLYLNEKI